MSVRWMVALVACALLAGCSRNKPASETEDPVSQRFAPREKSEGSFLEERFAVARDKHKSLTLQDFAARSQVGREASLDKINFDPSQARFFSEIRTRLRLSHAQVVALRKVGFVVQPRASHSFADAYYLVYTNDLPVFVTTDSVLHAWHRSFDSLLLKLEEQRLANALEGLLVGLRGELPEIQKEASKTSVEAAVTAVDVYLAVALSLLRGVAVAPELAPGRIGEVQAILQTISAGTLGTLSLFSRPRQIDFSLFTPTGHYVRSKKLTNYFRALKWCGHVDLRIADNSTVSTSELEAAIVLTRLLSRAELLSSWRLLDDTISLFTGPTDSATPLAMRAVLDQAGVHSLRDLTTPQSLQAVQVALAESRTGVQQVSAHVLAPGPEGSEANRLPRSFTLLGQRFAPDAWAMSRFVNDQTPIERRVPSGLDVAYSVFGNDAAAPLLAHRMSPETKGVPFRDGVPIQANLVAVREIVDNLSPEVWSSNLYLGWLGALRALSEPSVDPRYPQALRTRAWANKTLNTQLASWTELRHDTTLYVKEPVGRMGCEYPAGFVEPNIKFWKHLEQLARQASRLSIDVIPSAPKFFQHFSDVAATLGAIAEREVEGKPLDAHQIQFLKEVVDIKQGYAGMRTYRGWYPSLFYGWMGESDEWDALTTSVFVDPPDPSTGDPGAILYEAVGDVDLMAVVVDSGGQKSAYAGPLLSWYEFTRPAGNRLTDNDWQDWARSCRDPKTNCAPLPKRPEFTSEYLVTPDVEQLELKPGRVMVMDNRPFGVQEYELPGSPKRRGNSLD